MRRSTRDEWEHPPLRVGVNNESTNNRNSTVTEPQCHFKRQRIEESSSNDAMINAAARGKVVLKRRTQAQQDDLVSRAEARHNNAPARGAMAPVRKRAAHSILPMRRWAFKLAVAILASIALASMIHSTTFFMLFLPWNRSDGIVGGARVDVTKTSLRSMTTTTQPLHVSMPSSRNAYVFLLTNCHISDGEPDNNAGSTTTARPSSRPISVPNCRPMFFGIVAAAYQLKHYDPLSTQHNASRTVSQPPPSPSQSSSVRHTSNADIVVLVQMDPSSAASARASGSQHLQRRLATDDEMILKRLGIHIVYLPSDEMIAGNHMASTSSSSSIALPSSSSSVATAAATSHSFYAAILAKMHAFRLTQYDRIIFLDADILPLRNLDYLFQLSFGNGPQGGPTRTSDNPADSILLHAMYGDPVNAGLFVITPSLRSYDELHHIATTYSFTTSAGWMPGPADVGIPHTQFNSTTNDYMLWDGTRGSGWDFYCANSDQGLLLYWAKYVQRTVTLSIIVGEQVEVWSKDLHRTIVPNTIPTRRTNSKWSANVNPRAARLPFYQDFHHAVGLSKFWNLPPSKLLLAWDHWNITDLQPRDVLDSTDEYWWYLLYRAMNELGLRRWMHPNSTLQAIYEECKVGQLRGDLFASFRGS